MVQDTPKNLKGFFFEVIHPAPSEKYSMQLWRSVIVSAAAFIINIGAYYALKQLAGINYLIAAPLGYCLGVILNYYLSVKWVFAIRKLQSKHMEFTLFVVINLIGLAIYEGLVAFMVEAISLNVLLAPVIATILVFFWNFLARKKVLY